MDDFSSRRRFFRNCASTMASFHLITADGQRITRPSLCERIYTAVASDGRPYFSDPLHLGDFVSLDVPDSGRKSFHGHLAIGSCRWLGYLGDEMLKELFGEERIGLETNVLNWDSVLDLMDQFWLHEGIDKNNPAIAYATEVYVSTGYFLKSSRGLSQDIDFSDSNLREIKSSASLNVPLLFDPVESPAEPPVTIRPGLWQFAKPQNPSNQIDFHRFESNRMLSRGENGDGQGSSDQGSGSKMSQRSYLTRGATHVTTFIPAGVEDGSMMERVIDGGQAYSYHELFQPVRFKQCLRVRFLLLARLIGGPIDPWVNQVNVAFEASTGSVMDINLRSQHFEHWAAHHVGMTQLLDEYAASQGGTSSNHCWNYRR